MKHLRKLLKTTLSILAIVCAERVALPISTAHAEDAIIRIPAEAASNLSTEGKGAANAGLAFEYETASSYVRVRGNLGANAFTLSNAERKSYANIVLQPDSSGFSFAVDGCKLWGNSHTITAGIGGHLRISPYMTWSVDEITVDAMTNVPTKMTYSGDITSAALLLGGMLHWNVSSLKDLPIRVGLTGGASLRGIVGDIDDGLLMRTLGTSSKLFGGGELRLQVKVRDFGFFGRMPFLWSFSDRGQIQGLTGIRFLFGVEISGKFIELKSPESPRAPEHNSSDPKPLPPPPRPTPDSSLRFSL